MGQMLKALEWVREHPEVFEAVEPVSYEWREVAEGIGMFDDLDDDTIAFIGTWPDAMRNVVISMLASHARGDATVRLSWVPAYDFTMTISKANFGAEPEYQITLGSKYPPEAMREAGS